MIGQETIDRVRQSASIVEVVGEVVRLTRKGRSHLGLCPFHKEKTPSFNVSEERGFYHCFGCGKNGDAITFVREIEGLDFTEAIRRLAERFGIEVVETGTDAERREQLEVRRRRDELHEVSAAAAAWFERMLREHPLRRHALAELERRGLATTDATGPIADALQAFRVGYAPYGWDGLATQLKQAGFALAAADKVGLVAPRRTGSGYYDRFRHRLMFAVLDLQGRVIAFSGRSLTDPTDAELRDIGIEPPARKSDDAVAKYINSPESPIYKKREAVFGLYQARQHLHDQEGCVLVEGNFDVVSLHARGLKNVVAPLGTAFTTEQARGIHRFTSRVTLLFDGDAAGRRAVGASREACAAAGLTAKVASLPDGVDPDDLVRARGVDAARRVLGTATGLLEYLMDSCLDTGFAADDAQARAAKIREVLELISSENDPTVRAMAERHADHIAERLGIADVRTFRALETNVRAALHRAPTPADSTLGPRPEPPMRARSRDRRSEIGLEIVGALLDYPELLDTPGTVDGLSLLEGDAAMAVAALRQGQTGSRLDPELILAKLPASIHPFALARLAAPRHHRLEDALTEMVDNVSKLQKLELLRLRPEVVEELHRAESVGDFDQQLTLLQEQFQRARERRGLGKR